MYVSPYTFGRLTSPRPRGVSPKRGLKYRQSLGQTRPNSCSVQPALPRAYWCPRGGHPKVSLSLLGSAIRPLDQLGGVGGPHKPAPPSPHKADEGSPFLPPPTVKVFCRQPGVPSWTWRTSFTVTAGASPPAPATGPHPYRWRNQIPPSCTPPTRQSPSGPTSLTPMATQRQPKVLPRHGHVKWSGSNGSRTAFPGTPGWL